MNFSKRLIIPSFMLLLLFLGACTSSDDTPVAAHIDFKQIQPLPTPEDNEIIPLRVAISAVISPQGSINSYSPLIEYLEQAIDRPVEVVQRRTYAEVNDLLEKGEVDLAFVCTSQYVIGADNFGMKLLVAPQVDGETTYQAVIIVPADSDLHTFNDLKGKVFAFTDPMSLTGRIYPLHLLIEMGTSPEEFFSRTFYTYSHDDAIYAVSKGVADGAAVDSLVLDFAIKRDPELTSKIRVIHKSEPFGIPPVVVGPNIRPQLELSLREALLKMPETALGREALAALDYDRFVIVDPELYEQAFEIEHEVSQVISRP